MNDKLIKLRDFIDAKSLRERALLFAGVAGLIVFVIYTMLLSPLFAKQLKLRQQISQQNNNIIGIEAEIQGTIVAFQRDPDAVERARLNAVKAETDVLSANLNAMQSSLVPPERIGVVLQSILKGNRRLRLLGLNNLPAVSMKDAETPVPGAAPRTGDAVLATNVVYRHGVDVTLSGNYLDMVDYMVALESMPSRLYWGKAKLDVEEYPNARLTLTLYTLSLDKNWMKL